MVVESSMVMPCIKELPADISSTYMGFNLVAFKVILGSFGAFVSKSVACNSKTLAHLSQLISSNMCKYLRIIRANLVKQSAKVHGPLF